MECKYALRGASTSLLARQDGKCGEGHSHAEARHSWSLSVAPRSKQIEQQHGGIPRNRGSGPSRRAGWARSRGLADGRAAIAWSLRNRLAARHGSGTLRCWTLDNSIDPHKPPLTPAAPGQGPARWVFAATFLRPSCFSLGAAADKEARVAVKAGRSTGLYPKTRGQETPDTVVADGPVGMKAVSAEPHRYDQPRQ